VAAAGKTLGKGIFDCKVLSIENLSDDIFRMKLHCPEIAVNAMAGQFVNIKVNNEFIPLLRKPFSVSSCDAEKGWFEIVWKVIGKGTRILSEQSPGKILNVIGPLGSSFQIPENISKVLVVAGGLGVAPFPLFCRQALSTNKNIEVFLGARDRGSLVLIDDFQAMGIECYLATEDGSTGRKGFITELVTERLQTFASLEPVMLASCGPMPFLRAMQNISVKLGVTSQISIETMMGCGFGICMGCPVGDAESSPDRPAYKLTCLDGPVFNADEVLLHG
jgi:dihydroorotate dehydrogenase electron transfer subunit